MCIAALSIKGGFSPDMLREFFASNPHGGSFTYAENGKIVYRKHMMVMDEYIEEGRRLKEKTNLMTHCRWRTQGALNIANAHPFLLNKGKAAMVHNGNFFTALTNDKSDSVEFAEMADILGREELITTDVVNKVNNIVGGGNKMIVLYDSGNFTIYNEHCGQWRDNKNMWLSNAYFRQTTSTHHYN